jgi:DNA-binding NtrC family response regulator
MNLNNSSASILIVDDDDTSLLVIGGYLRHFGFTATSAPGGRQALELLGQQEFDLLISDLHMPDMDGLTLLTELRERHLGIPFIIVTACGSIESAVDAMRLGACDYLEKPYQPESLRLTVQRALDYHQALAENRHIKAYLHERFMFQNIITTSAVMKEMLEMAARVASSPQTTIAIYGESGTGKEVLARAIHFASNGLPGNFIAVNCAAIPEALLESELFGHNKGAFTGADRDRDGKFTLARGGTVFLDEIGDMPLQLQAKLLRVLEERVYEKVGSNRPLPVEFRVIVATHRNLAEMVRRGTFREDLFHRINVVPLSIPPLRERVEDIPLLTDHFLSEFRLHQGKPLPGISKKATGLLTSYHWPGNIRELRNTLEYAAIMVSDELIRPEHLRIAPATESIPTVPMGGLDFHICMSEEDMSLDAITSQVLQTTLTHCGGNKSRAAALLKVDRKRFYR